MMEITFYPKNNAQSQVIEISEEVFEWLAKSEFSKIGKSVERKVLIEEDEFDTVPVVQLTAGNRKKFIQFFRDEVIKETKSVFSQLGESPSKQEYQTGTYRLRKLLELLTCVENENYHYLQRI